MNERYEIQARLLQRRNGLVVRNESRLARASTQDEAMHAATAWAAEGFNVWIFRVEPGDGVRPVYQQVQRLQPSPPSIDRRGQTADLARDRYG